MNDYTVRTIAKLAHAAQLSDQHVYRCFIGDLIRLLESECPIAMTFGDIQATIEGTDISVSRSRIAIRGHGIQFSMLLLEERYDQDAPDDGPSGYAVRFDDSPAIEVAFAAAEARRLAA